jgi:hypothetical protein
MDDMVEPKAELLPCPFCGGKADPLGWASTDSAEALIDAALTPPQPMEEK